MASSTRAFQSSREGTPHGVTPALPKNLIRRTEMQSSTGRLALRRVFLSAHGRCASDSGV